MSEGSLRRHTSKFSNTVRALRISVDPHNAPSLPFHFCSSYPTITTSPLPLHQLVLVVDNHGNAGGEEPPSIYKRFLGVFWVLSLDVFTAIPGAFPNNFFLITR